MTDEQDRPFALRPGRGVENFRDAAAGRDAFDRFERAAEGARGLLRTPRGRDDHAQVGGQSGCEKARHPLGLAPPALGEGPGGIGLAGRGLGVAPKNQLHVRTSGARGVAGRRPPTGATRTRARQR